MVLPVSPIKYFRKKTNSTQILLENSGRGNTSQLMGPE